MPTQLEQAGEFVAAARRFGAFAFDVENPPNLRPYRKDFRLCGCSFATGTYGGPDELAYYFTDPAATAHVCGELFPEPELEAVAFNAKYDLQCLRAAGVIPIYGYPVRVCDPMVAMNLIDDNRHPNQLGLKVLMRDLFGEAMMEFEEAWKYGEHSPQFHAYGRNDSLQELRLWQWCKPRLQADNLGKLFDRVLMPMNKVFADMELEGCRWDLQHARVLLRGFQEKRRELEAQIKSKIGDLNINSGDQLARRLFDDLGYSTKGVEWLPKAGRWSVDARTMDHLARRYPVCHLIRLYRTACKMISTYVEPLSRAALEDSEQRVHPTFWLTSATGRTRSTDPNFQNIPVWLGEEFAHLRIRDGIVAAPGWKLIVADLSQIELRLCAHVTGDAKFTDAYTFWQCTECDTRGHEHRQLLHACPKCGAAESEAVLKGGRGFWHGKDIHTETAQNIKALGGDRKKGKVANFALIYLITAYRLHYENPDWSVAQWQEVVDEYFSEENYYGVSVWHGRMERALWEKGVVQDIFGRKRRLRRGDIERHTKHALNQFVNFPMQAGAGNYIMRSLGQLREHYVATGEWIGVVRPTNFVHDEVVLEVPEDRVADVVPVVRQTMENVVRLNVPVRVGIQVVDRWGKAKD